MDLGAGGGGTGERGDRPLEPEFRLLHSSIGFQPYQHYRSRSPSLSAFQHCEYLGDLGLCGPTGRWIPALTSSLRLRDT